jgi:neutral ceramidase
MKNSAHTRNAVLLLAYSFVVFACRATHADGPVESASGSLRAGAATSIITPEIGRPIIGGFVPFPSKHIHDELRARCLVLDDGQTQLALVVCDLLGIDRIVSDIARQKIAERHNIPPDHVLISATHTHSASSALGTNRWELHQPADEYQQFVAQRIADGVTRAFNQLRPAELAFGTAEVPEHLFNRRWHMRVGTVPENPFGRTDIVKMNPPRGSSNLIEPAGPIDPVVPFLAVRDSEGYPVAVYAAYSLHYVGGVRSGDVSADYFAVFSETLADLLMQGHPPDDQKPDCVAMMANATSGDINNINFREPRPKQAPYEQMRYVGRDVASHVHAAMSDLDYRNNITLAAAWRETEVTWRHPTETELQWAQATLAETPKAGRDLSRIYAERTLEMAKYPQTAVVPLQVLRIGDVCLGTMPFEVFCEIGLEFRERCPHKQAFMVELAHGYFGYLPTPRHHDLGGYETWLGTNRVERAASTKLLAVLLDMSAELQPGNPSQ